MIIKNNISMHASNITALNEDRLFNRKSKQENKNDIAMKAAFLK